MPSNYEEIRKDNIQKYGTDIYRYGPVLLANLYSDRTHFVYELLQNAEDAGAKEVKFVLFKDRLELRHNGRLFDEDDVKGICGLVEGTKKTDLTQIGKFGIGFKSVYAYTNTPRIYSGDESFYIENYVHPQSIEPTEIQNGQTLFVFPFNHEDVAPEKAFSDIAVRLQQLGLRTLLFLNNVQKVYWEINGVHSGGYERRVTSLKDQIKQVDIKNTGLKDSTGFIPTTESWLVFDRPIDYQNFNNLRVKVAYQLEYKNGSDHQTIVPVDHSTLVVFFPTEKETHLNFLIHGPYRTTPARDNIPKDDDWNKRLIRETVILVSDSISRIKSMGFLTVDFLDGILPIDPERFPEGHMFRPIYDSILEKFSSEETLLPTQDGGYVDAKQAFLARGRELIDLLGPEQLKMLFENRNGKWLDATITQDRTPVLRKYLMNELNVPEIDGERFANQLNEKFIEFQSDAWITDLYKFLNSRPALWQETTRYQTGGVLVRQRGAARTKSIIRLSDGRHVLPFDINGRPNAYLPTTFETTLPTVKKSVISDNEAKRFLVSLGFETFDVYVEVVEQILPKYRDAVLDLNDEMIGSNDFSRLLKPLKRFLGTIPSSKPSTREASEIVSFNEGLNHHRKISQVLSEAAQTKREKLIEMMRDLPVFVSRKSLADGEFYSPSQIYLSSSYTVNTKLEDFFKYINVIDQVIFLDDCYIEIYDAATLQELGCVAELDIVELTKRFVLPKYHGDKIGVTEDENKRDVEIIIEAVESAHETYLLRFNQEFRTNVQNTPFLSGVNVVTKNLLWRKPQDVFLTEIYTGNDIIETYFDGNPDIYFLDQCYRDLPIENMCSNLEMLGCLSEIQKEYKQPNAQRYINIRRMHGSHKRGLEGFDPDFEIFGLDYALKNITLEKAKIIWGILKSYHQTIRGVLETSTRRDYSGETTKREQLSIAGKIVCAEKWLPDRDGDFHQPSDLRLSDLPENFDTDSWDAKLLAERLELKKDIEQEYLAQLSDEKRKKIRLVDEISLEKLEELLATLEKDKETEEKPLSYSEELRQTFNRVQIGNNDDHFNIPPAPISNPEHRRNQVQQDINQTIQQNLTYLERFTRIPTKKWERKDNEIRIFLKEEYRGKCQICGYTFAKRNGEPYFEGLYLVSRTRAAWLDRQGNVLSLCANCSAKLLYGQIETEEDIIDQIMSFRTSNEGGSKEAIIKLKLCGDVVQLKFSERHILDLQEMLKVDIGK